MVEKPFGTDLASAQKLNETMHQYFGEDAIFRVDHWLGLTRWTTCCSPGSPTRSSSRC